MHCVTGGFLRKSESGNETNNRISARNDNHTFNIVPNLLNRNFSADQPNQKWTLGNANIACQHVGGQYQLYLDARGLALFGRGSGSAFPASDRLAGW